MEDWRNHEWERDFEAYTSTQVEAVADYCNIEIVSETASHFQAYCPFHNNTDSPAFVIDKQKGLWTCFNPSCDESGNLPGLLKELKGLNIFEADRVINKYKNSAGAVTDRLAGISNAKIDFVEFPYEPVKRMKQDFWNNDKPQDYMKSRGFEKDTLEYFDIGYSIKKDMTIVPMHDPKGMLIGFVGRAIDEKVFKNTKNLPKSKTAWNYHRAKQHGDTVVIVESSFDAMRVHQAGYPNVIALLGGHVTQYHLEQIDRTFTKVINMTDFDKKIYRPNCSKCKTKKECEGHRPGRELAWSISNGLPNKKTLWAAYNDECVYPHQAKDVGDMSDEEIRTCLKNAVSTFTYARWGIDS